MNCDELQARMTARLNAYERRYGCKEGQCTAGEERDQLVNELESSVGHYWPHSTYAVLRAMLFALTHPCPAQTWWREVEVLIHVLNVEGSLPRGALDRWAREYGEESAAKWRRDLNRSAANWLAEVVTWPVEDQLLIHEWLMGAREWRFVQECFVDEVGACLAFWSSLLSGHQG